MKKVIILRKIQVAMKTFAPPFFNHFSLSLNRKKTCDNESHEKETKHIHASFITYKSSHWKLFYKKVFGSGFFPGNLSCSG